MSDHTNAVLTGAAPINSSSIYVSSPYTNSTHTTQTSSARNSAVADPGSSGSAGSQEETTGKRIACMECRQQKVRCDAHEKWPSPCSRCSKKESECKLEPSFKRTSKRQRILDLEKEMEDLRRKSAATVTSSNSRNGDDKSSPPKRLNTGGSSSTVSGVDGSVPGHRLLPSPIYFPRKLPPFVPIRKTEWPVQDWICTPKTIDGFTLSSETIKNLFKEFVDKYHPFLPVVDVSRGPEKIHSLCPSLFWTIMAVASRRYDKDGELMMQLTPLLKTCLAEITISPVTRFGAPGAANVGGGIGSDRSSASSSVEPGNNNNSSGSHNSGNTVLNLASVYSVQAFLICTMWPPLTSTISADSSWNSAGIAMFNSIRVGLHCPGYARDFGRIKQDNAIYPKITEQVRTWICCNIVSQSVAGMFGFPSFTSFDATVLSACRADSGIDIPESIRLMMMIQRLENEVEKGLNSNLKDPLGLSDLSERLSLIQMMAQKLDELELTLSSSHEFDESRRFMFLAARVHLMTYYFLDNDRLTSFQQQRGLVQAYNASLALLDHCDQVCRRDKDFIRYLPQVFVELLWQSTSIVNKIYHSHYAQYVDTHAGRSLYIATVQHVAKASILKHDMAYRAAEIMQQIWQVYDALIDRPDPHQPTVTAKVSIRTRMAASVFFDCLWTMREQCEIRSVAPAILNQRTTVGPDDELDENLSAGESLPGVASIMSGGTSDRGVDVSSSGSSAISQPNIKMEIPVSTDMSASHTAVSVANDQPQLIPVSAPPVSVSASPNNANNSGLSLAPYRYPVTATSSAVRQPISPSPSPGLLKAEPIAPLDSTINSNNTTTTSTNYSNSTNITVNSASTAVVNSSGFDWDVDSVWKDVDSMMNDFGFRVEEVASFM